MAVYDKEKYEAEVIARRQAGQALALGGIASLQRWAQDLFNAAPPPFSRRAVFTAPAKDEDDLRVRLFSTINRLKLVDVTFDHPHCSDVNAEYVFASEAAVQDGPPTTGPIILYVHGGGFIYGSPATARRVTRVLAALTGGCCLAVQYSHATTQPFPAQLLDVLVVYLSLLSSGISKSRIVFAGESSGLSLLMLQYK